MPPNYRVKSFMAPTLYHSLYRRRVKIPRHSCVLQSTAQTMFRSETLSLTSMSLLSLSFLLLILFPLSTTTTTTSSSSIQELLQSQGLPGGLFPENVKSYNLDQNGRLEVNLGEPCFAKYETRVYFDSVVRANLSYGGLMGLEGLTQEELFLWLPVKGIVVSDPSSGLILFDIGVAHKQLSLSLFEDPPSCKPQGVLLEKVAVKEMGFSMRDGI